MDPLAEVIQAILHIRPANDNCDLKYYLRHMFTNVMVYLAVVSDYIICYAICMHPT